MELGGRSGQCSLEGPPASPWGKGCWSGLRDRQALDEQKLFFWIWVKISFEKCVDDKSLFFPLRKVFQARPGSFSERKIQRECQQGRVGMKRSRCNHMVPCFEESQFPHL